MGNNLPKNYNEFERNYRLNDIKVNRRDAYMKMLQGCKINTASINSNKLVKT